ncbi:MAG: hypothetical protein IPJ65_36700 [Archangiaceae bacterium]|nr:hypothetical protein [Archangiaceae bacterium]
MSVRLKLKQPAPGITLGKTGWATVKFGEGEAPPKALAGWIVESHRIVTRGSFDAGVRSTR